MAVPAPWEKNNSDLFLCLFLNRKHAICAAPWTLQMIRTDETSSSVCFYPPGQTSHDFKHNAVPLNPPLSPFPV